MNAKGGWAAIDKRLVPWAVGLDPQQLRVARLTAAFALALFFWGPIFAVFYGLLGAYRLSVFVLIAVGLGGLALGALRAKQRRPAAHLLVMGLLGVLAAIGGDTRGVFSPTLMWLPVVPIVALLLLGLRAALVWGAVTIGAVVAFAAAALTGSPGEGVFTGAALTAYHAVSLLSTIALQVSLAMLFESAKVRMAQELEAQRDLAARAHDDVRRVLDNVGQALFVVDAKGQVGPSPSATALEWFGANEGRAAWDWLTADGATRGAKA